MKTYLVIGAERSGIAVTQALLLNKQSVILTDTKDFNVIAKASPAIAEAFEALPKTHLSCFFGSQVPKSVVNGVSAVIPSPGVPLTIPVIQEAYKKNIPVISEVERPEYPLIFVDTGGFKGNSYYGYDIVIKSLFEQYIPVTKEKDEKLVNLLGLVPAYDPFFRGDLEEIRRILSLIGVKATTFVTPDQTIEDIRNAGKAALNIVLSSVNGIRAAKAAKEKHGIEYIVTDLPIGSNASVKFAIEIAEKLGIDREFAEKALEKEVERYYSYVDRATDVIADTDFQNYAVVVNNATQALPYAQYLDNEIGWLPEYVFITDELREKNKEIIRRHFEELPFEYRPKLVFETDTSKIQQYITQNDPQFLSDTYYEKLEPAFVLGSSIDRKLSQVLNGNFLNISFPAMSRIILNKTYAGFNGGLALLEDLITAQVSGR